MSTKRKSTSEVWDFFKQNGNIAACNMCNVTLKFSGSTSTLWHHLRNKHGSRLIGQSSMDDSSSTFKQKSM